jgi:hypothetical protein
MGCFSPIPWTTAQPNQIPLVLSENFQHELEIEGISIRNPLL